MTVAEKILKEVQDLPVDAQARVLKAVHQIKKECGVLRPARRKRKIRSLKDLDALATDMGVTDLAEQHDHYLYGVPKK